MRVNVITKEEIIDVAEKIIKEEGISKCSMRRLSRELDIATGTMYNYYESRDTLLLDVFEISWKRTLHEIIENIDESVLPLEQIKGVITVVQRDVKNRNGLGKEIVRFRINEKGGKGHLDLRGALRTIFCGILSKIIDDDNKCMIVSRWIVLILIDKLEHGLEWSQLEWEMIDRLAENNS